MTSGEDAIAAELRQVLAEVTGRPELAGVPLQTSLFGGGVGLDSLAGTLLLRQVQRRYGVDVAAEDLNLDSLETLGTLAAFIAARLTLPKLSGLGASYPIRSTVWPPGSGIGLLNAGRYSARCSLTISCIHLRYAGAPRRERADVRRQVHRPQETRGSATG